MKSHLALASAIALTLCLAPAARAAGGDRTLQPEEDDFSSTPFTEYGEFNNQEQEEEEDTKFFQYGRFFGLSIGMGVEGITGNRGALYQGGFPLVEFKLHYWFDFNVAMALAASTVQHSFDDFPNDPNTPEHHNVNITHLGFELKYYFDTKNLSAPITFANPYLFGGIGTYTEVDNNTTTSNPQTDTAIGFTAGGGFEFALRPRKIYLETEAQIHSVTFKDTNQDVYKNEVPDLTGLFYTLGVHLLFTF